MAQHEIKLKTSRGEMVLATDNIKEIFEQNWFMEFMDGRSRSVQEGSMRDSLESELSMLRTELSEMKQNEAVLAKQYEELRDKHVRLIEHVKSSQGAQQAPSPQAAGSITDRQAPQRAPPQAQHSQNQPQQVPDESYLNVDPHNMDPQLWNDLTTEQQQEWMQKYNMGG